MERDAPEQTVWRGTPSLLAELPRVLGQAAVAAVATVGLRALAHGTPHPEIGARDPTRIFTWLTAGVWIAWALAALTAPLRARATRYVLTTERLRVTTGLLSTTTEDVELRRVRDLTVMRPFFLRLLGLGHVMVVSADSSTPRVVLRAVRDPDGLQSKIREIVQALYVRFGMREIEMIDPRGGDLSR
jgi:uncharacterized membrane protein YdbT with pleckstrin-like domain